MNNSRLFSTKFTTSAVDWAMLILRCGFSILMIPHGYSKLMSFAEKQDSFMNFLGLGSSVTLALVIFAELFCSILLVLGLFTRLALIPLIITTLVIIFMAHGGDILGDASAGFSHFLGYVAILLIGPGQYSLDQLFFGKRNNRLFAS